MALIVHKSDVDGQTGMVRFRVQAETPHHVTGEVTRGPVEHISIFPQALANLLGEDHSPAAVRTKLRQWMEPRHREMCMRKKMIEAVSAAAIDLPSKVEFGDPERLG